MTLTPYSWKDKPALIESLFPVQKLSVESFKEQMAGQGKTLTALGSFWKGRKPLILNKACVLGCLLPATNDALRDLEIFELLMAMDESSLVLRKGRLKPEKLIEQVSDIIIKDYFEIIPAEENFNLPEKSPFSLRDYPIEIEIKNKKKTIYPKLQYKKSISYEEQLKLESRILDGKSFREIVHKAKRAEEISEVVHNHIWQEVNEHLGTSANSFPELVEQMGIARFGHRPKVADVFCGSGQIPFEAARLGCDVYASDLNPIACLLTWGAFNIVGANEKKREELKIAQEKLVKKVQAEMDALDVESDGNGWTAKAFLYCVEVKCPETGWMVPLIPSLIISKGYKVIAKLGPVAKEKRYDIAIKYVKTDKEVDKAKVGTVQNGSMVHSPDGKKTYSVKISTIRGDYTENGENKNRLRLWEKEDFIPREDDIFQERLYCIQWMKHKEGGKKFDYKFRSVTEEDLQREQKVIDYVKANLKNWQEKGYIPEMKIESGYNTDQPIRERGWTHWHHLFNPRQLLIGALYRQKINSFSYINFSKFLDYNAKLCIWDSNPGPGRAGKTIKVFYNMALNTFFNYACRSSKSVSELFTVDFKNFQIKSETEVISDLSHTFSCYNDIYITDPPYGDAVKYEEITEFFIAWLRKNPPEEFSKWTWDSRRALAIKGDGEEFRQGMIASYKAMREHMPDNGIQVLMFTHKSGSIWADLANIIWASGLQVTAAWYVVTESDSALRQGANVTGTILLILRKRKEKLSTFRDDLGWEIKDAVQKQVESLIGLDNHVKEQKSEGLYADVDIQMAGYAAALKVLTTYAKIDGKDMEIESKAPKKVGGKSFIDELINFAVGIAVEFLIPGTFTHEEWSKLNPIEKYYLKMIEAEEAGENSLDAFLNFAKAFRVQNYDYILASSKANKARLKTAIEMQSTAMSSQAEFANTPTRAALYALYELSKEIDIEDVLSHLMDNCPDYLANKKLLIKITEFIAEKRESMKPKNLYESESSTARILIEGMKSQRL